MGAFAIPIALAAVSAGANYVNSRNTARKQDNALAAQIRMQQQKQREADARTTQLLTQQGKLTDQPQKQAELAQFQKVLAANGPQSNAVLNVPGAVSDAYRKSGSDAALGIADYGNRIADLTSSIDAPTQMRRDNQKNLDNYAIDIGGIARALKGQNYLANLKLASIRRNPWLDAVSSVAGAAAGAYGGGGAASMMGGADTGNHWYFRPNLTNNLPDIYGQMTGM